MSTDDKSIHPSQTRVPDMKRGVLPGMSTARGNLRFVVPLSHCEATLISWNAVRRQTIASIPNKTNSCNKQHHDHAQNELLIAYYVHPRPLLPNHCLSVCLVGRSVGDEKVQNMNPSTSWLPFLSYHRGHRWCCFKSSALSSTLSWMQSHSK